MGGVTALTPVWEGTDFDWLEERNVGLREAGVVFGYAGPPAVLDSISRLHRPWDGPLLLVPTDRQSMDGKRNMLLHACTTRYCMMVDDDDVFDGGGITATVDAFDTYPDSSAVLGGCLDITEEGTVTALQPGIHPGGWGVEALASFWEATVAAGARHGMFPFHMGAGVWRVDVLRRIGGFAEEVNDGMYGSDMVAAVRAAAVAPVRVIPRHVMWYRKHDGSLMHTRSTPESEAEFMAAMRAAAQTGDTQHV